MSGRPFINVILSFVCLSAFLSCLFLSICLSVCPSICLSVYLSVWPSATFMGKHDCLGCYFWSDVQFCQEKTGSYSVFLVIGIFLHIRVSFFRLGVFSQELYYLKLKLMKLTYEMEKPLQPSEPPIVYSLNDQRWVLKKRCLSKWFASLI